ncbi:TPA: transposase [Escherichia coli]
MFQLGIDVSKKTLDLCLLREGVKGRVKTRKLQNDINAVSAVIAWLSKQHCKPEDVHIIMEATGVYHESLAYGLHNVTNSAKVIHTQRLKSDPGGNLLS